MLHCTISATQDVNFLKSGSHWRRNSTSTDPNTHALKLSGTA